MKKEKITEKERVRIRKEINKPGDANLQQALGMVTDKAHQKIIQECLKTREE